MPEVRLEFSEDDLSVSNAACSRVDITELLKAGSLHASGGYARLGDPTRAAELSFTLWGRDFEPLNVGSPYYPNVVRRRRFFVSFLRGATWEPAGVWYARSYNPSFPGNVTRQEVDIVCGDGSDILANERLPALDPPSAQTYEDVVMHDAPFWYGHTGELFGTQAIGVVGPEGIYRGAPALGQPGLILGSADTAVIYRGGSPLKRLRIAIDETAQFLDSNRVTAEAWVRPASMDASSDIGLLRGPETSGNTEGSNVFSLKIENASVNGAYSFAVLLPGNGIALVESTTIADPDRTDYVRGVWDGNVAQIWINDVLEAEAGGGGKAIMQADAGGFLEVGSVATSTAEDGSYIDEPAFYETALPPERGTAHYEAGSARGFQMQLAGERIAEAAASSLWSEAGIDSGSHMVLPRMMRGQSPLEEIEEARRAEGIRSMFFYDRDGDPQYRGWNWGSASPYNEPQATFGAPPATGELAHDAVALRLDDEFYTEVSHSRQGGLVHTEARSGVPANERSAAETVTDLILVHDHDVMALCGEKLAIYGDIRYVIDDLSFDTGDEEQEELFFDLYLGSRIRYKRRIREDDGSLSLAYDISTHIIGFDWTHGKGGRVTGKWILARGFNAALAYWRAGAVGYSEAGATTVAAAGP